MPRQSTRNAKPRVDRFPCVFRDAFVRETIDPQVSVQWKAKYDGPVPFGDLRRIWKYEHCRNLNPGGSFLCRFPREDCALAFLAAVQHALSPAVTSNPVGYYRRLAKSMAIDRADRRPLEREVGPRNAPDAQRGDRSGPGRDRPIHGPEPVLLARDQGVSVEEPGVRRTNARPVPIGDVLGALNLGPRQELPKDGSASGK